MEVKKTVLITLSVAALAGAALLTVRAFMGDATGIDKLKGETVYIKCLNDKCGYVQEMDKAEYLALIHKEHGDIESGLKCPKCNGPAVRAIKCPRCGLVFHKYSVPNDFEDRCPGCGFSAIEQGRRKQAKP